MERTLISPDLISAFCQKHHIRRLAFFGSVVRDDFRPDSDIDLLVEFEEEHTPGLDFFLMESELSDPLGRRVDLQTRNFLSADILKNALSEMEAVYEHAWFSGHPGIPRTRCLPQKPEFLRLRLKYPEHAPPNL
jgi:predicted nucleotidyltransferase